MNLRLGIAALALVPFPLAGCATESRNVASEATQSSSPAPPEPPSIPKALDCRGLGTVGTDGGELVAGGEPPKGSDTPEQAVEGYMAALGYEGYDYVIDIPQGAWVLRPDGSAIARLNFLLGDGWLIHGYEACG